MTKKMSVKKIIALVGMALILVVVMIAHVMAKANESTITRYLIGVGNVDFGSAKVQNALKSADLFSQEIAAEGVVLLKNDEVAPGEKALPLSDDTESLSIFGWSATDGGFIIGGAGSGEVKGNRSKKLLAALNDPEPETLEEGVLPWGAPFDINWGIISLYESFKNGRDGDSLDDDNNDPGGAEFFRLYEPDASFYTSSVLQTARNNSDVAVVVISRLGGENKDLPTVQYKRLKNGRNETDKNRTYLQLSAEEESMLEKVRSANFERVILLINTVNTFELDFLDEYKIDAALAIGALGQSGTLAVRRILRGIVSPSGKTADTWLNTFKDNDPTYYNSGQNITSSSSGHIGVTRYADAVGGTENYIDYQEGIYVGYKYHETAAYEAEHNDYDYDYDEAVRYPFGYGLSYTEFEFSNSKAELIGQNDSGTTLKSDSHIRVSVDVKNIGNVAGKEVVQAYVSAPYYSGEVEKAHVALMDFDKSDLLEAGESQTLTLEFDAYDFASYDYKGVSGHFDGFKGYILDPGNYYIRLQTDSHNLVSFTDGSEAEFEFTVGGEGIKYDQDITVAAEGEQTKVLEYAKNRFTGVDAYAGVPIDGGEGQNAEAVYGGAGITFLSRADFAGTFPHSKKPARPRNFTINGNNYGANAPVYGERPETDSGGNLKMTDEQLVLKLGANYNDPVWDDLLGQMKVKDLYMIVQYGGYRTAEIESIDKPNVWDFDGPSGINTNNQTMRDDPKKQWTAYPTEIIIGQTFSKNLAYTFGLSVAFEASVTEVGGWYAPACNLRRSPFEGRNFEYFSEDAVLSGIMSAEIVEGALVNNLYCYVKHFAVNETETHRSHLNTWLSEQALRELYLKPFEIAVKDGKANAIMTGFNQLGTVWTGGNKALCDDILRSEWGFRGSVVTDYANSLSSTHMSAAQGLRAGQDLWLTGASGQMASAFDFSHSALDIYENGTYDNDENVILMNNAAHHILFTYCNTFWYATNHNVDPNRMVGDSFIAAVELKSGSEAFPAWWLWIFLPLDIVMIAGFAVWIYFLFFRVSKKKRQKLLEEKESMGIGGAEESHAVGQESDTGAALNEKNVDEDKNAP